MYTYAVLLWFYSVIPGKCRKCSKSYYSFIILIVGDLKYKVQSELWKTALNKQINKTTFNVSRWSRIWTWACFICLIKLFYFNFWKLNYDKRREVRPTFTFCRRKCDMIPSVIIIITIIIRIFTLYPAFLSQPKNGHCKMFVFSCQISGASIDSY